MVTYVLLFGAWLICVIGLGISLSAHKVVAEREQTFEIGNK
jgi:hypothetical protein